MTRAAIRRNLAAVALIAVGAGCTALGTDPDGVPADAQPLPVATLAAADHFRAMSGIGTRERLVVRDPAQWAAVWTRIVGSRTPVPPVPAVDFERQMVLVAAMGGRPTGGYGISVESAAEARGGIYVEVTERSPGARCGVTQAFTAPLHAVLVPRHDGPVTFVERTATTDCR